MGGKCGCTIESFERHWSRSESESNTCQTQYKILSDVYYVIKKLFDDVAGEELRICYIDASMDRDARQNILSNGFGFECRCPRCLLNDW